MNIAANSLSKKIYAIIVIIAIIVFDFLFAGKTLVSYAIDTIQTNGPNTEVSEYFLNLNEKKNNKSEKEIRKDDILYQDIDSNFDVSVLTSNNAAIIETHKSRKVADIDSLPEIKNAKEDNLSRANVLKSISISAAIRYISNTISIIAIIAVCSYFAEKKVLKDNIRF